MLSFVKRFAFALVFFLVILFGYQNLEPLSQTARFRFNLYAHGLVFESPELPVVFLLAAAFLLGMMAAGFQGFYGRLARRIEIRRRDRRIRELEQELAELHDTAGETAQPSLTEPGASGLPPTSPPAPLEENPTL